MESMRGLVGAASVAAVLWAVGGGQPANAASLLSITGASDLPVPANNDLVPTPNAAFEGLVPLGGVIDDRDASGLFWSAGTQVSTTANNVTLSYNYIGSLAAAINVFSTSGGSFTTPGLSESAGGDSTPQASFSVSQALAGLVDFSFSSGSGGASVGNVAGNNAAGSGAITFSAAYLELQEAPGGGVLWEITDTPTNFVLLLLDDSGAGADADYDDLGVVLVATPIPAALPLLGTALVGLALLGWRRRYRR